MLPSRETRLRMFFFMLLARRLDERAWALFRQGKIAYHISGIWHEAIQVAAAMVLRPEHDWVAPYYRDLGLMLVLGMTAKEYMLGLMGKKGDPASQGRQMPGSWSLRRSNVLSVSSSVAAQAAQAVGVGLAMKLRGGDQTVLVSMGEGATCYGEWFESVNWAVLHQLPVIFLIENNQYAVSRRQDALMPVRDVVDRARGLGLPGVLVDGTSSTAVYQVIEEAVQRARQGGGPTLVEARTYRMTPHSSDDDDRSYRQRQEVEAHRQDDPLLAAQRMLESDGSLSQAKLAELESRVAETVEDAVAFAEQAPFPAPDDMAGAVFAPVGEA